MLPCRGPYLTFELFRRQCKKRSFLSSQSLDTALRGCGDHSYPHFAGEQIEAERGCHSPKVLLLQQTNTFTPSFATLDSCNEPSYKAKMAQSLPSNRSQSPVTLNVSCLDSCELAQGLAGSGCSETFCQILKLLTGWLS